MYICIHTGARETAETLPIITLAITGCPPLTPSSLHQVISKMNVVFKKYAQ